MTDHRAMTLPAGPEPLYNPIKLMRFFKELNRDPLGHMSQWQAAYGDIVLLRPMGQFFYTVLHPEGAHEILVTKAKSFHKDEDYKDRRRGLSRFLGSGLLTSDGDFWRKQRKLVAPAFHTKRISEYAETMVDFAQQQMTRWQHDSVIDVADHMTEVTLMIVAKTLFNTDMRDQAEQFGHAVDVINQESGKRSILPTWVPTLAEFEIRRTLTALDEIVYSLIEERRASGEDKGDLLSMLILTEDEDGNRMSDEQVRDEAVTILMAGHETTANTLNWALMLLAQHPEIAEKLHEELDTVLSGRAPTLADLRRLPYTEMVIKESMRLYPPAWGVGREAVENVQIMGYDVPKGASVGLSFYHIHRDPRWWDDPLAFKPERFGEGVEHGKYTYLPFGSGPRVCIGNSFAMMEAQLLLATFAQAWTFALLPDQVIVPEPRITMYPRDGLPMRIRQRQTVPTLTPA